MLSPEKEETLEKGWRVLDLNGGPEEERQSSVKTQEKGSNTPPTINRNGLHRKINIKIALMVGYLMKKGKEIPDDVAAQLLTGNIRGLIKAHGKLCAIVAPSSPETIFYIQRHSKKRMYLFSPIPLVRNFIIVGIIAIVTLLGVGLSEDVNAEILSKGILNNHGLPLLKNLIFLCSGAGIGTVFFSFIQAHQGGESSDPFKK